MRLSLIAVAATIFVVVHQFYIGWDLRALSSELSIALLEIAVLVPLLDGLTRARDSRNEKKLRNEYSTQSFYDFDEALIGDTADVFSSLAANLSAQFDVKKVGRGTRILQNGWERRFSVERDMLHRYRSSVDRLGVLYIPMMIRTKNSEAYGRIVWLNAILGKLERAIDESKFESSASLTRGEKDRLSNLVTVLAELAKWLKEGAYEEDNRTDSIIVAFFSKFSALVEDETLVGWFDTVDWSHVGSD